MINKETVLKVADLARLNLSSEQAESHEAQFNKILTYFNELQKVNTDGVEPMVTPHDLNNTLREDIVEKKTSTEDILKNAPDIKNALFKVPPVV